MILRSSLIVSLCFFVQLVSAELNGGIPKYANRSNEKATHASITDEAAMEMYQKWVDTGLSSIMSALANKRLKSHRREVATKFGECSYSADSLPKQAKCLSKLLRGEIRITSKEKQVQNHRLDRYKSKHNSTEDEWQGAFRTRVKREVHQRENYHLYGTKQMMSPLGGVAKMLMESVLAAKNKTKTEPWQKTVSKLRDNGIRKLKIRKEQDDSEESVNHMTFDGIRKYFLRDKNGEFDADDLLLHPNKLKSFLTKARQKKNKKPAEKLMDLLRDGVKLGYSLSGQNTTGFEDRTMKLFSPRFMGVAPKEQQEDEIDFLSPSLFSLHDEGEGLENLTSLPNLLRLLSLKDQQHWLNLIMEATGVTEQSDKLEKELEDFAKNRTREMLDPSKLIDDDGIPMYFTKENATLLGGSFEARKIEVFEKLHKSYTKSQLREMNSTGYTMLRPDQIFLLYGPHSPYNNSKTMQHFMRVSKSQMHQNLENDVQLFSDMQKFQIRQKDIVLSPISFTFITLSPTLTSQPLILSPVIFSPLILSPSIFGVVVLSPWMFVPLVLSPRILGSLILSPFILSPLILTPLALHPAILSPGVFNPMILSPALLTPLILSPQVFTPLILSPLALSPIILNPLAGSPLILSPFVLTPIIASPQFLGGLILSPYVLSPVVLSPLIAFAAVLSPSFLS